MASAASTKLGILAGGGRLPELLVQSCCQQGIPFYVIGFDGFTDSEWLNNLPHDISRIAAIGKTIKLLKQHNVTDVVMAGSIIRPSLSQLVPDAKGAKLLMRLAALGHLGDDALLRELAALLEKEGISVCGAHEVEPSLLAVSGVIAGKAPSSKMMADIKMAVDVLGTMARHDIGQAMVVQDGLVLGLEAIEGTRQLIRRCTEYARKGPRPVLVKCKKQGQDIRFDLPAIGPQTIDDLIECGYAGMAIEAEGTLILDKDDVIAKAEEAGIFIYGINVDG